jgi:hypothetical protein
MNNHRQRITDGRGATIGYTNPAGNRVIVSDATGNTRGWTVNGKTFDKSGNCVSQSESPGLLLGK